MLGDLPQRVARANISLCMIVRSEERVLAEALASAAPFFTDMIVVDTGSTDRTPEIARAAGARVVEFPWVDSFALARSESLRHARGDWIFWMDADDTLPDDYRRTVEQQLARCLLSVGREPLPASRQENREPAAAVPQRDRGRRAQPLAAQAARTGSASSRPKRLSGRTRHRKPSGIARFLHARPDARLARPLASRAYRLPSTACDRLGGCGDVGRAAY